MIGLVEFGPARNLSQVTRFARKAALTAGLTATSGLIVARRMRETLNHVALTVPSPSGRATAY
jgi:hypothetical protein